MFYAAKRLILAVPTVLVAAVAIFLVLRVVPGDVVVTKLMADGSAVSVETVERERSRLGLDKPLLVQFGEWMSGLARLDLGRSMWTGRPVTVEIGNRFILSFQVAVLATIIALTLAIPLGIISAVYRDSPLDYAVRALTIAGLAVPSFWFGMLIVMALLNTFNWLPPSTQASILSDPLTSLSQLFWPALAVGYRFASVIARLIRSSLIEVLQEDYVRTARAKGGLERIVIVRHALPNALLPALTMVGLEFAFLMGGLVVTEQVFNLNGLGRLFVEAVQNKDFVLIQGITMVLAVGFVIVNLAVDLLYGVLDPRLSAAGR